VISVRNLGFSCLRFLDRDRKRILASHEGLTALEYGPMPVLMMTPAMLESESPSVIPDRHA